MSDNVVIIPKKPSTITRKEPSLFLLYGPPKVGKTTLISTLPNNLILDLERGSEFNECLSMQVIGWRPPATETAEIKAKRFEEERYYFTEAGAAIHAAGKPYDFVTVDTVTMLEEYVLPEALADYKKTAMGSNYDGNDVRLLPKGAGYGYLRNSFQDALNRIRTLANNIILIGHLKDSVIEKAGKEVNAKDLDLTGKLKLICCAASDCIGYLHRGSGDELLINFKSSDQVLCGSRISSLRGQEIKIADYNKETNNLENIRWDLIYPDTLTQKQ
jgi:hypothetical protein